MNTLTQYALDYITPQVEELVRKSGTEEEILLCKM
jgi:hypothetical protein